VNGERLDVQRLRSDIREKERKLKREISKYHKDAGKKAKKINEAEKQDEISANAEDLRSYMPMAGELNGLAEGML